MSPKSPAKSKHLASLDEAKYFLFCSIKKKTKKNLPSYVIF